jgi:hypothetical protein
MRTTEIWAVAPDGEWRNAPCHVPIWISSCDSRPVSGDDEGSPSDSVLVAPIEPHGAACAALLKPDGTKADVRLNGLRIAAGLHVLQHGDRLSVDDREIHLAIRARHHHDRYDPDRHGDPIYCARTKSRLQLDDPMVLCGGKPSTPCGLPYAEAAWAADIACHGCGATTDEPGWSPPPVEASGRLDALLHLVSEG